MTVLVACETLVLALLVVLVVGLLRSHAEILRRLEAMRASADEEPQVDPALPQPGQRAGRPPGQHTGSRAGSAASRAGQRAGVRAGHDLVGVTLAGDAVQVGLGAETPPTLLAFLSSGCSVCRRFWDDLRAGRRPAELPSEVRLLAVTKDPSEESPARLRELAGAEVPVVMSSAAWRDYGAPGAPYFVYLERGDVHGEGSASSWQQIASLLRDAIADHAYANGGERRTREIDRILASAGIGPDDSSLYPGRKR